MIGYSLPKNGVWASLFPLPVTFPPEGPLAHGSLGASDDFPVA